MGLRSDRVSSIVSAAFAPVLALAGLAACGEIGRADDGPIAEQASAVTASTPVGLALEVENGAGAPLQVRAGQTFYVNQIDIRAALDTGSDEGIDGIKSSGDFAGLKWNGASFMESDFAGMPNPDGTFSRRRYYRQAHWMDKQSSFDLDQLDSHGHVLGKTVHLDIGQDSKQKGSDAFFVRRLRAIQWTNDCPSPVDCTGASHYTEEALVEVRDALDTSNTFTINPATTALRLRWSIQSAPYVIPLTQVASPPYDYGFSIDIDVLTPPASDGTYAPGSSVTFQATLRDGSGNRLHPQGSLPSFFEAEFGPNPAGIQYYHAFFDPTILYYRRKHRERMMIAQFIGPVQDTQAIHNVLSLDAFLSPLQYEASPSTDGFFGAAVMFPRGDALFGGAFDPSHEAWGAPVSDTWTHQIAADAKPGTYLVTMKARRVYLGQDIPFTRTIQLQVGSPQVTHGTPRVGGCNNCHSGGSSLANVLHANSNLSACDGCHVPLPIELSGPVYARTHFLHSRSGRYDAPLTQCSQCHLSQDSIQRTSKSACLSCHNSYPQSHVDQFGPITNPFVGGGPESLAQCSTTCHTTHPGDCQK